jgi:hypothetical protein
MRDSDVGESGHTDIAELIRHSPMAAQAAGEARPQSWRPLRRLPRGQSFDDVIQVELEFLHRHAKKADRMFVRRH